MDQQGSLVDTKLRIYPSEKLIAFIKSIPLTTDVPPNIIRYIKGNVTVSKEKHTEENNDAHVQFTKDELEMLNRIKKEIPESRKDLHAKNNRTKENIELQNNCTLDNKTNNKKEDSEHKKNEPGDEVLKENKDKLFLTTSDIDWVYNNIVSRKTKGEENLPFLHELFQGSDLAFPENRVIKRNPILEARCVKLRAQQEAREYRKMTKGVDNVRMKYPEDSISYQLKQLNRQLIAIGQFIISIFAGFLFGFRGVEWMVGNLEFGVRLLLGVMCALIIALAEIYFLAKKLNEELTMTETVQLGGPPKFADQPDNRILNTTSTDNKEHQD